MPANNEIIESNEEINLFQLIQDYGMSVESL